MARGVAGDIEDDFAVSYSQHSNACAYSKWKTRKYSKNIASAL